MYLCRLKVGKEATDRGAADSVCGCLGMARSLRQFAISAFDEFNKENLIISVPCEGVCGKRRHG